MGALLVLDNVLFLSQRAVETQPRKLSQWMVTLPNLLGRRRQATAARAAAATTATNADQTAITTGTIIGRLR